MVSGTSPEPISLLLVIPAAGHPCSSAITHLPLATKGKIFFQHQNKKKLSCIDGDFFLIQENMELCLKLYSRNASEADSQSKSSLCSLGWEGNGCCDRKKEVLSQELSTCYKSTSLKRVLITFSSEKENTLRHREGAPSALWKWEKPAEALWAINKSKWGKHQQMGQILPATRPMQKWALYATPAQFLRTQWNKNNA